MAKVRLLREKEPAWHREFVVPLTSSLPFFQRDGDGYVHRVRSSRLHLSPKTGEHTHTSVTFWCGQLGFLYPEGKWNPKHKKASVLAEPSPWRLVCATCEGRAIGAGQVDSHKIGGRIVKFKPHVEFA